MPGISLMRRSEPQEGFKKLRKRKRLFRGLRQPTPIPGATARQVLRVPQAKMPVSQKSRLPTQAAGRSMEKLQPSFSSVSEKLECVAWRQRVQTRGRGGRLENRHKKITHCRAGRRRLPLSSIGKKTRKLVFACVHKSIVTLSTNSGILILTGSGISIRITTSGTFVLN